MRSLTCSLVLLAALGAGCGDDDGSEAALPTEGTTQGAGDWRAVELMAFEVVDGGSLQVSLAYCGDNSRVAVEETADTVTIRAETSDPEQPPAPDCGTFATAALESPLASRTVVDPATGESVPEL